MLRLQAHDIDSGGPRRTSVVLRAGADRAEMQQLLLLCRVTVGPAGPGPGRGTAAAAGPGTVPESVPGTVRYLQPHAARPCPSRLP
eukprot:489746-Hanusia_phi.AAC.9